MSREYRERSARRGDWYDHGYGKGKDGWGKNLGKGGRKGGNGRGKGPMIFSSDGLTRELNQMSFRHKSMDVLLGRANSSATKIYGQPLDLPADHSGFVPMELFWKYDSENHGGDPDSFNYDELKLIADKSRDNRGTPRFEVYGSPADRVYARCLTKVSWADLELPEPSTELWESWKREEEQDSDSGGDIQFQHPQSRAADNSYHNGASSSRGSGTGANSTPLNSRQPGNPWSQGPDSRENQNFYSATQEPPRGRSRRNEPPGGANAEVMREMERLKEKLKEKEKENEKLKKKEQDRKARRARREQEQGAGTGGAGTSASAGVHEQHGLGEQDMADGEEAGLGQEFRGR
eukprot:g15307.t1